MRKLMRGTMFGVLAIGAQAAPVTIINPGFEDISGETIFNEFTFGPLNGWALYDPGTIADGGDGPTFFIGTLTPFEPDPLGNPGVYVNFPDGAPEGARVAIAFNFAGSGGSGEYGYEQVLSAELQANTTYTLEVDVGNIASGTAMSGEFFDLDGFPGYRVELRVNTGVPGQTQLLAQDDNQLAGLLPEGEFRTSTVSHTTGEVPAQIGQQLVIRLVNTNVIDPVDPGANLEVDFDNVRLDASPAACPGDADGSGVVDLADLNLVLFNFGSTVLNGTNGDVNSDGGVDLADLNLVLFNFGNSC